MIAAGTVTIQATPTLIHTAVGATRLLLRTTSSGVNVGSVWLGDGAVSANDGFRLLATSSGNFDPLELLMSDGDEVYGVHQGGGVTAPVVDFIATN